MANSVKIISESIRDETYFEAVTGTVEFLQQDGNGIMTINKIVDEIKKVKSESKNKEVAK